MWAISRWVRAGRLLPLLAVAVSLTGNAWGGGILSIVTVGTNAACDFSSLQDAIDAGSTGAEDLTEIRLARDLSNQSLSIIDRNITIEGNWPSCTSGLPQQDLLHTLSGNGADTVLQISTTGGNQRSSELSGLVIRGGGANSAISDRGGGLRIEGRAWVTVNDSRIGDNESSEGGGAYVNGPFARLILNNGTIVGSVGTLSLPANRAINVLASTAQGGGLWCGGGAYLGIGDARIRSNTSAVDGGGVYLDDCEMQILPRPDFVGEGDGFVTFFENVADGNGGGIYAGNNSTVSWASLFNGHFGGRATGNRATDRGGAIYLTGASGFIGTWIRLEDNRADGRGGALAIQDDSAISLLGGDFFHCSGPDCPGIYGTRGITEGESATLIGGAVYADSGGLVNIQQASIVDNFSNNGSAIHLSGSATEANLHSVLIARNFLYGVGNGTSTIELTSSARATFRHMTMAGNFRASEQFPGLEQTASSIRANGNSGNVTIINSLLWNDATQLVRLLAGATATGSCVFGHEGTSFTPTTIADPHYVDTTGSDPDYSLQADSVAIDYCASSNVTRNDLFGNDRPADQPRVDVSGPYDAGAIEFFIDKIFENGFQFLK